MCCCKCFQYYLETIYWHTIEKHFCFDVNIALYEDEDSIKETTTSQSSSPSESAVSCRTSNNNIYDNMAFYDNVAIIANRSIFIIDSKDGKTKPKSPSLKDTLQFTEIEKRPSIDHSLHKEIFFDQNAKVVTEQPKFSQNSVSDLTKSEPNLTESKINLQTSTGHTKAIPLIRTNTISLSSLATISEDHEQNPHLLSLPAPNSAVAVAAVKLRKKSLHERRVSKSLTLDIDHKRQEVPIIRQSSFPKFYIETPEANQNTSTIGAVPIQALETPVAPSGFKFDLRTVVQLEDERREMKILQHQTQQQQHQSQHPLRRSVTSVKETKRMQQIRDKLKPIMLLRNASSQSLYSQT